MSHRADLPPHPRSGTGYAPSPPAPDDGALILAAMSAAPDGIVLVNSVGVIVMVNAAMEAISGYCADELCGQPVHLFLPQAQRRAHSAHIAG